MKVNNNVIGKYCVVKRGTFFVPPLKTYVKNCKSVGMFIFLTYLCNEIISTIVD